MTTASTLTAAENVMSLVPDNMKTMDRLPNTPDALLTDEYQVSLGDDSDCETCGWSYNSANFYPTFDDDVPGSWMFTVSVGCYGASSAAWDSDDPHAQLEEAFTVCRGYEQWNARHEQVIRDHLAALSGL
jgi:hypothetical protein